MKRPVILLITVLLGGCGYGRIQELEDRARTARLEIEVQLQRRADLVPNLIETVRGYVKVDPEVVEGLADARVRLVSAVRAEDLRSMGESNVELSRAIRRLLAVADQDTALRTDPGFKMIESRLRGTEDGIGTAGQEYNEAVEEYNAFIKMFPQAVTAKIVGAESREFFKPATAVSSAAAEGG